MRCDVHLAGGRRLILGKRGTGGGEGSGNWVPYMQLCRVGIGDTVVAARGKIVVDRGPLRTQVLKRVGVFGGGGAERWGSEFNVHCIAALG